MPIYEYECANSHRFEQRQGFHDAPVGSCPTCKAAATRILQSVPVIFKGSGFYVNDYGRSRSDSSAKPENGSKPDAKTTDAKTAEAKAPAAATAAKDTTPKSTTSKES